MANKREQRIRRKARAALRLLELALGTARRDLVQAAELHPIALAAIRYVDEIYAPNIKEPFSIANRRMDLVEQVRAYQARRGHRKAA